MSGSMSIPDSKDLSAHDLAALITQEVAGCDLSAETRLALETLTQILKDSAACNTSLDESNSPQKTTQLPDNAKFYFDLFEKSPIGLCLLDKHLKVILANPEARQLTSCDFTPNSLTKSNRSFTSCIVKGVKSFLGWIHASNRHIPLEITLFHPKNTGEVQLLNAPLEIHQQKYFLISLVSIHKQKRISESAKLYQLAFDKTHEGILITDGERKIIDVNPAFTEMTGYSRHEALGKKPNFLKSGKHTPDFYEEMNDILEDKGVWQGIIYNKNKDGRIIPEELKITAIFTSPEEEGPPKPDYFLAIYENAEDRLKATQKLSELAETDSLTKLANRAGFNRYLKGAFDEAQRNGEELSLLMIDLDKFKSLNDNYGHHYGDEMLKAFAKRITNQLKSSDYIARLGGDEFMVIINNEMTTNSLEHLAQKLILKLSEPYQLLDISYSVTVSIGIARYPDDAIQLDKLLTTADAAMYQAKQAGRNQFKFYDALEYETHSQQEKTLTELARAIDTQQFELYYQPQHDMRTGQLTGFESLVRWSTDEGIVMPGAFIPLIENTPLIVTLGNQLLSQVFHHIVMWQTKGIHWPISINFCSYQLQSTQAMHHLARLTEIYPTVPAQLHIEMTETSLFERDSVIEQHIQQLQALGFKLVLDDFGTGFASIYSLKKFKFETIKIDKSFVDSIEENDAEGLLLLDGIIDLIQALKINIVCEGVETLQQVNYLTDKDCPIAQGFYYSQAIHKSEVVKYCKPFLKD
ncbi:EAL domain-containing protein [Thiosulfativibrio zosterae]|uniref:GGDEF domain-containing protein n=1 Tax=Thiosulfativibrio zosterae TaxID=2675053 RepID=A0A6F8PKB7_9GAMM|nr:EAL domain-containing protein [Thiosulfativibrio zosterae]BBP42518.1 hypothetical protein THMIRHAT_02640 [Thiosulfativibrio zosterae]